MFRCLGSRCPGCSTCDPLRPLGAPPTKNVTPRRKPKPCGLCGAPVEKKDEAIVVGPHVSCMACTFPDGYSAEAATKTALRLAARHGLSIPTGFAFK